MAPQTTSHIFNGQVNAFLCGSMAATSSVTSVGGMLIVTQVIPQDVGDTKSMPPCPAAAAPPTDEQPTSPAHPAKKDAGFADYQRGEIPGLAVRSCVPHNASGCCATQELDV